VSTALAVVVAGPALASDWPGWRGPNRDAVSPERGLLQEWGPGGPPLAWKASGVGSGFSSVAVAGDRIYTMGDKDGSQHVFALKREGGAVAWKTKVGPPLADSRGGGAERERGMSTHDDRGRSDGRGSNGRGARR
jgi:hypothetical protein